MSSVTTPMDGNYEHGIIVDAGVAGLVAAHALIREGVDVVEALTGPHPPQPLLYLTSCLLPDGKKGL